MCVDSVVAIAFVSALLHISRAGRRRTVAATPLRYAVM